MSLTLAEFDELPSAAAADHLRACCGATRWVAAMTAERPFHTLDALLVAADEIWWSLDADDWREAFTHHPRIGERHAAAAQSVQSATWAVREQGGVDGADADARAALEDVNHAYEHRFGQIYLVCATGKDATQLLAIARERMSNDPETELRVAAEEQRKITRLRLEKLFAEDA